jgi:hypothetical protein
MEAAELYSEQAREKARHNLDHEDVSQKTTKDVKA